MKTSAEIMQEQIAKLSFEEKRAIFPPMEKKNFVVRKSWYGRRQLITFRSKPNKLYPEGKEYTYDHDIVLDLLRPHLETKAAWKKYGYWSQSTDLPMQIRFRTDLLGEEDLPKEEAPKKATTKKATTKKTTAKKS